MFPILPYLRCTWLSLYLSVPVVLLYWKSYFLEMCPVDGVKPNHIQFLCAAHPKISLGEIVRVFKSINAREIFQRYHSSRKSHGVENSGLMDIMLPLLVREETGIK